MSLKEKIVKHRKKTFKKHYKVGLCLSGGGAKGFAHMGAFKAFEEYGITFDAVAGSSAGSLFGALYCSGLKYEDMYKLTGDIKDSDFRHNKLKFLPSNMDALASTIENIFPYKKLEDLKIPLYVVAVDIRSGKEIHFSNGDLIPILTGSCAIPGIFVPVRYKNMILVDGGVCNNVPADVLRDEGCDFVITVDCNCARGSGTNSNSIFTQFTTTVGIMMANNSKKGKNLSDIIICPDMRRYKSLKIISKNDMIEEGYRATKELMPEIENLFMGKYRKR